MEIILLEVAMLALSHKVVNKSNKIVRRNFPNRSVRKITNGLYLLFEVCVEDRGATNFISLLI